MLRDDTERRIFRLAIPALGTLAVEPLYVLVDTAIVGRMGTPQLAGLAVAATVLLTVVSLTAALEYGLTPDVAHAHGRGDAAEARRVATNGLQLAALIGVPIGALLAISAEWLCWLIGGRGEVLEHATTYLRISAVGLPFVLIAYVGHGVMRGVNQLRKPLVVVAVANVANLIIELIAVYVFDMGIAGSAWSTVIAQAGAAVAFGFVLRPHLTALRPTFARMRPLLESGRHFAIRSIAMFTVWNTATFVAARIDTATLAAHQVITQLFILLALVLDALAIPAQSLVAGALGAGAAADAERVGRSSARLSLWAAGVLAVALVAISPFAAAVFTDDSAVRSRLIAGLLILAVMQFPGAIAFAYDGALIGAEDERWLGRQAVVNLLGYAPLALATLFAPRLGLAGLWGAQMSWMVMRAWVNAQRWRHLADRSFGLLGH